MTVLLFLGGASIWVVTALSDPPLSGWCRQLGCLLAVRPTSLTSTGALVFASGLMPPSSAITVDNTGESLSTVNGPFIEAPEYLGGFWVSDVADEEAALGWAARA